jgi:dihydroceramidase
LRRVQRRKDGGLISTLAFTYWGLIGVGVLSAWFHATLKYHSQMGDDLSMFLAVGALLNQLMCFDATPAQRQKYTFAILGSVIPVSIYHVWADEIYVHELTFGVMIFLVGRRIRMLIKKQVKSEVSQKKLEWLIASGLGEFPSISALSYMWVADFGTGSGLFGYFLWNIDFHLCGHVTAFKHWIGLPWGFLFELHGWWHFFTGIMSYVSMALVEYLVTLEGGQTGRVEEGFVWPVKAVLRDLDQIERKHVNGIANGTVNGKANGKAQ